MIFSISLVMTGLRLIPGSYFDHSKGLRYDLITGTMWDVVSRAGKESDFMMSLIRWVASDKNVSCRENVQL